MNSILNSILEDKKFFLLLNLSLWGVYIFLSILNLIVLSPEYDLSDRWVLNTVMCGIVGFTVTGFLGIIYVYLKNRVKNFWIFIPLVVLLSFIFSIIWILLYRESLSITDSPCYLDFGISKIIDTVFQSLFILLAWSAVFFLITYWKELNMEKEKSYKMNLLLLQSQFNTLKYQVNPHFLFNSLNSIIGLIDEDKEKAKETTSRLSDFFRDSLLDKSMKICKFDDELKVVENYIEIERIRFEENLVVNFDIDEQTRELRVPSFLIQPLVENAIKYGKITSNLPLEVKIRAKLEENTLLIEVSNSGSIPDKQISEGNGIGIKNLTERLEWHYPESFSFSLNESDKYVTARIRILNINKNIKANEIVNS